MWSANNLSIGFDKNNRISEVTKSIRRRVRREHKNEYGKQTSEKAGAEDVEKVEKPEHNSKNDDYVFEI